jgi:glycosyltransferase involved in cell wall biosynthesis
MRTPRVSILLPSYNHAPFLRECIRSIQAQTFDDWELIAIDDGSTDESVAILRECAEKDSRIQVEVNIENLGTYGTEQRALERSKGSFVAVMNSDDLWHPEKLEIQVGLLEKHPTCGLCYVLGSMVDEAGKLLPENDVHIGWPRSEVQDILPFLLYENRVLASGVLFRRETLRFETTCRYSGDWVALLEQARGRQVAFDNRALTFWRQHDMNSYKRSANQVVEEIRVREAIMDNEQLWFPPHIHASIIRASLLKNSMLLFDLGIYFKEGRVARKAGRAICSYYAQMLKSMLKRTLATYLPGDFVRNYLVKGTDREAMSVPVDEVANKVANIEPLKFDGT